MKDQEFAGRLAAASPEVVAAAARYASAAAAGSLATSSPFVLTGITNKEMSRHYDRRLASAGSPGRQVYDHLRALAAGRCPYCGQRPVRTLDHYWPKGKHAAVALVPDNLVPACRDCNTAKGQYQPDARSGELLHPYFDVEHSDQWLKAALVRASEGPAIVFRADPPATWLAADADRVREHFRRLELGDLYAIQAVDEVISMSDSLERLLEAGDPNDVRDHLASRLASAHSRGPNSWRTALYAGLLDEAWFWRGGFKEF